MSAFPPPPEAATTREGDWMRDFLQFPSTEPRLWRDIYAQEGKTALCALRKVDPEAFGPSFVSGDVAAMVEACTCSATGVQFLVIMAVFLNDEYRADKTGQGTPYWKLDVMRSLAMNHVWDFLLERQKWPAGNSDTLPDGSVVQPSQVETFVVNITNRYLTGWDPEGKFQAHNKIPRPVDMLVDPRRPFVFPSMTAGGHLPPSSSHPTTRTYH